MLYKMVLSTSPTKYIYIGRIDASQVIIAQIPHHWVIIHGVCSCIQVNNIICTPVTRDAGGFMSPPSL
jgi:hypothetical protein